MRNRASQISETCMWYLISICSICIYISSILQAGILVCHRNMDFKGAISKSRLETDCRFHGRARKESRKETESSESLIEQNYHSGKLGRYESEFDSDFDPKHASENAS